MSKAPQRNFTKKAEALAFVREAAEILRTAKGKYDHIDFKPPESVANAAERGLEYRKKGGGGGLSTGEASKQGIGSGVQRATNLKNRNNLSPATVRRMHSFFSRHEKNKAIDAKHKGTPWKDRGYVAWCLKGDSEILLATGEWVPISKVVDEQLDVEVVSYNEETGECEPKRITGWSKAPSGIEDFYVVGKHKTARQGISSKTFLAATSEHPFYVDGEWVEAQDMEGRNLSVLEYGIDKVSEQVLFGTMLGDAYIWKSSKNAGTLRFSHGEAQREWKEEKQRLLSALGIGNYDLLQKSGYGSGKLSCRAYSKSTLYLSTIEEIFYGGEGGEKTVTQNLLQRLDDVAVAVWFQDDGKLKFSERDGYQAWSLHTEGFDEGSIVEILKFFKGRYELDVRAHLRENTEGHYLYFTVASTKKLMEKLAPYFHPSMRYKLWPEYREASYLLEDHASEQIYTICKQPVTKFGKAEELYNAASARKPYKWEWRYNLEVEGNHNFIANGFLVHNCLWGGDPGAAWAAKVVRQMDAADEKAKKASMPMMPMPPTRPLEIEEHPQERDTTYMSRRFLRQMAMQAYALSKLVNAETPLMDWQESKITSSAKGLNSVFNSLMFGDDSPLMRMASDNEPTNPKLWRKVQALVRGERKTLEHGGKKIQGPRGGKGFVKHPSAYCVPLDSEALTPEGWKTFEDLLVGDQILAYDCARDVLDWSFVKDLHFAPKAQTVRLKKQSLDLVCTPDHRWLHFLHNIRATRNKNPQHLWSLIQDVQRGVKKVSHIKKDEMPSFQHWWDAYRHCASYEEFLLESGRGGVSLVPTKEMSLEGKLLVSAPYRNSGSSEWYFRTKYRGSWLSVLMQMSPESLESFYAACVMCDGWQVGASNHGFSQKDPDHADAFELCAFLTGRRVRRRFDPERGLSFFSVNHKRYIPLPGTKILQEPDQPVWCPETELGTWVMRQNGHVLITGNSNGWATKAYNDLGGGWRKKKDD